MKLVKNFLTKNKCYITYRKHKPVGLFLHSIGCSQPSAEVFLKNWNVYQPGGSSVCVHGFISDTAAYQTLPWDCVGWHSGQGKKDNANFMGYLGFEMTEPSTIKYTGGATFIDNNPAETLKFVQKTYENAVDIYAQICVELDFNPLGKTSAGYPVILSHSEGYKLGIASNHGDVEHLWNKTIKKTMDDFRNDVYNKMKDYPKDLGNGYFEENIKEDDNTTYKVQVGAYSKRENADATVKKLKAYGFDAIIVTETKGAKQEVKQETSLKVGDKVKLKTNACIYGTTNKFSSWVYNSTLYVRAINGDKITVSTLQTGAVTGNVKVSDIIKQ